MLNRRFTDPYMLLCFANAAFGGCHVGLTDFSKSVDPMETLSLFIHTKFRYWFSARTLVRAASRVEGSSACCLRNVLMESIFSMARSILGLDPRLYAPMLIKS